MPQLPTISGGPGETASAPASSAAIGLTAHASANTKGGWTELIASTAYDSAWMLVTFGNGQANGIGTGMLADVGVGASTAEQVLVPNLRYTTPTTTNRLGFPHLFPLRVARGTRLSARCQSTTGSQQAQIAVVLIASAIGGPPGCSRVEAIGANTGTSLGTSLDCGASANTDVVAQLTASTGFAYRWMCVNLANTTDSAISSAPSWLIDIMVGGAGAEQVVLGDLWATADSTADHVTPGVFWFPCSIAAGSRVSARARCSSATSGDRVLDIIAYGVG